MKISEQKAAELAEIDEIKERICEQLQDLINAGGRPFSRLLAFEDIQSEVESWIDVLEEELGDDDDE